MLYMLFVEHYVFKYNYYYYYYDVIFSFSQRSLSWVLASEG